MMHQLIFTHYFWRCLMCTVLLAFSYAASAVQVKGLYSAEIVVADKTGKERKRVEREGLDTVLVKVSGDSNTIARTRSELRQANVASYVSEFSYRSEATDDGIGRQTVAVINYSSSMVDALLTRAGCTIWPADRPELLVWMVVNNKEGSSHVTSESMPHARQLLKQKMAARGQLLLEPLLDLEDHLTLPAKDAWAFKRDSLVAAARRYRVSNWCVLRFYQTGSGHYRGTVQVEADTHGGLVNISADTLDGLIQKGVDEAVNRVAAGSTFTRKHSAEGFTLLLEDINNYKDYQAALTLLGDLEMVRSVRVASAVGNHLDLRLVIDGGSQGLLKLLRRNKHLQPIANLSNSSESARFRWQ